MSEYSWNDIATTAIALIALVVAVIEGRSARRHNMLSVQPLLRIDRDVSETSDIRIRVVNCGVGPAVIKALRVKVDALRFDFPDQAAFEEILRSAKIGVSGENFTAELATKDDVLAAGEDFCLLFFDGSAVASADEPAVRGSGETAILRKSILDGLARLSLELSYESMYGERRTLKARLGV